MAFSFFKGSEKIKSSEEQAQNPVEDKLTKEQALLYQEYATKSEGKKFSERAGKEAYKEAEELLAKLKDKKFDFLGIDWGKIDFDNMEQVSDIQERLDVAARAILETQSEDEETGGKGRMSKLGEMKKFIILPLALSIGIISGCLDPKAEELEKARIKKETEQQTALKSQMEDLAKKGINFKIDAYDKDSRANFKQLIAEWAHDNINEEALKKIELISVDSTNHDYEITTEGEKTDIVKETVTANLIFLTKDKKVQMIKGVYVGENAFKHGPFSNHNKELKSRGEAVKDALEQIKKGLN